MDNARFLDRKQSDSMLTSQGDPKGQSNLSCFPELISMSPERGVDGRNATRESDPCAAPTGDEKEFRRERGALHPALSPIKRVRSLAFPGSGHWIRSPESHAFCQHDRTKSPKDFLPRLWWEDGQGRRF